MFLEIFLLVFIVVLTLSSGFFSGSEVALFSLSPIKVKTYQNASSNRKRLVYKLLHRPRDLLVTIFILNTLSNVLLQNASSKLFGDQGWDLKVGVPLFLTLFFGEIIPKVFCMQHNVRISYYVAPIVDFFYRKLSFIRKHTIAITHPISRFLFFFLKKEESISDEELQHVLRTSELHGVLNPVEAKLVRGYLQLHQGTVKEAMVPEEDILYFEIDEPLSKLIHLFVEEECTRIPVCKGGPDHILGVISAKKFFLHGQNMKTGSDVEKLLRKPLYVPETTPLQFMMRQFEEADQVIAFAVDEYGYVTGLISKEDIAEQVIGEISDKRDQHPRYTVAGKDEIIASGKFELSEFNRHFNSDLKSPGNMVTIGGWLMERIGEIPKAGVSFEEDDFLFQILAADPNRIRRLYIRKLRKETL